MTFRCSGLAIRPSGNHAKAKTNAPGLPKQTSSPGVNPPEPGTWGTPPDWPDPVSTGAHTGPL